MSQESLPSFRKFRASGFEFEVFSKYEMKKVVGCGAFGIVTLVFLFSIYLLSF